MHTHHVMQRVGARATGAEEWVCPTCGRRLLTRTEPVFTTTVLAAGDAQVAHCGGGRSRAALPAAPAADPLVAAPEPGAYGDAHDRASGGADSDGEISLELLRPWLKAFKAIEDEGFASL